MLCCFTFGQNCDSSSKVELNDLHKILLQMAGTVPAKLILQLTTAFRERGLCNRSGNFFYKDHIQNSNVPVLAIAGDQDLICPPEAVEGIFQS